MISSVEKIKNFHMLPLIKNEILWRAPKVKEMQVIQLTLVAAVDQITLVTQVHAQGVSI